jgi:N-methylhydantoinase A
VLIELAGTLGLGLPETAAGIVRVAKAQIAKALRVVSVERGRDPRQFALMAFGGAGPLHQGPLSRELGCTVVIVPTHPGVLSALGLLAAPISTDLARTCLREIGSVSWEELDEEWSALEARAKRTLAAQGGQATRIVRSADCRYRGQSFELEVTAPPADADADEDLPARLAAAFHAAHAERYGYAHEAETVEVVNVRLRAEAAKPLFTLPAAPLGRGAAGARRGTRPVTVEGREVECPVFDRDALGEGDRLAGPAVVAGADSTCLLLPGQRAEVDGLGNLLIREG